MELQEETSLDLKALDEILASIPQPGDGDLIPILQKIQDSYGYLPPTVLMAMSRRTGIAATRIYGVITFY